MYLWRINCLLLMLIAFLGKTQYVRKAPQFFCACRFMLILVKCTLGNKTPATHGVFPCLTPHPIPRVDKYGMAITQISKSATIQTQFHATITAATSVNTTTFNINLVVVSNDNLYFTFMIVAVGYQPENTWVDVFFHSLPSDATNTLFPPQNSARNQSTNYPINTKTMFTSTANLNYATFIISYSLNTSTTNNATMMQFQASTLSAVNVEVRLDVQASVGLRNFEGTIIVFNTATMATDGAFFVNEIQSIKKLQPLNLVIKYPSWGPRFNSKCIIGYNYFYYLPIQDVQMRFNFTVRQNFKNLNNLGGNSSNTEFKSVIFCLSDGEMECDQNSNFYDSLTKGCYAANSCPIPTIDPAITPTAPQLCTLCLSTECIDCQIANRSYCIMCNATIRTTAFNGSCVCIAGYYRLGATCEANCSYFITGCKLTNCTSLISCNQCQAGYYLKLPALGGNCGLCSTVTSNCEQCSSYNNCTKCLTNFYINYTTLVCDECNATIANCITCTPGLPGFPLLSCDICEFGYINSVTTCECDEVNLTACAKCITPTKCKNCTNASYFLDPNSFHCELCTTLYQCLSCSGYNNCTSCTNQSFTLYLNTTDNSKLCKSCGVIMPNCVQCSSSTVCLSCEVGYGLNNLSQCQACSVLHPNCAECTNYTICDKCNDNNSTFFINSTCKTCAFVDSFCSSCILNGNVIVCLDCIPGYVLDVVAQVCSLCSTEIDDCVECKENSLNNQIECTLCSSLFLVDSNKTCQKCKQDKYVTRTCSNVTGCSSSHLINGKTVCLSCDASKHFQFDKISQKCLCQNGFSLNQLSKTCEQVCGDGILISMECDDGNTINGDGCSDQCMEQENFQCTSNSSGTSSCVLNQDISVVFDYMLRQMGENKVSLYFTVTPPSTALSKVDWQKTITFNFSEPIKAQFSYENGILIMTLEYSSDLDDKLMDLQLKFDPSIIKSASQKMSMKMQAANGPLNHENSSSLSNYKVSSTSGFALGMVCLLFYLISSYFHKMIGLETIQFIQLIYFVRIISPSTPVSSFYGFNTLKYSNGYNDIWSSSTNTGTDFKSIHSAFIKLNLKLHFLQNCNLMLIPVGLACLGYIYFSIQKSRSRAFFLETKEKVYKDELLIISRKVDWIYDNLIFNFTLSLLYLTVFSMLLYELSSLNQDQKPFFSLSFGVSLVVLFFVAAIYCYEIISGISKYFEMQDSKDNVRSDSKNLEYDANGVNHGCHPLYISVYLAYQLLVIVTLNLIFINFSFLVETILIVTLLYLIFICIWTPYQLKIHNVAIILNQSTMVLFILLQLLSKYKILQPTIYGLLLYVVMALITIALILQLIRLYIHYKSDNQAFNLKDGQIPQQNANPKEKAKKPKLNTFSLQAQMKNNEPRLNLFTYEETLEKMPRLNSFTNEKSKKLNQRLPESKRAPLKSQENPHLIEHGELVKDQCDSLEQTKKRLREEFNFYFKEQSNLNRHSFL